MGWPRITIGKKNPVRRLVSYAAGATTGGALNTEGGGWMQGGTIKDGFTGAENSHEVAKKEEKEKAAKIAEGAANGASMAEKLYGRSFEEAGKHVQKASDLYEKRLEGGDPITEALKQQKQQSMASTARNFAGRGVAGGVAAAGMEQAGRQKDIDIAASAYTQNAQNLKDYTNLSSNIASNIGMLTQQGEANAIAANPVKPQKGILSDMFGELV